VAKSKKARKKKPRSKLETLIRQGMEAKGFRSIRQLEMHCKLPTDSVRDMLRGRTIRNKSLKLGRLGRVSGAIGIPQEDLAIAAGIIVAGKSNFDLGPELQQSRRLLYARGGDPSLCTTPLGLFNAWYQGGHEGITYQQHNAGCVFASLYFRVKRGDEMQARSCLYRILYPQLLGENLMETEEEREARERRYRFNFLQAQQLFDGACATLVSGQTGDGVSRYHIVKQAAVDCFVPPGLFVISDDGDLYSETVLDDGDTFLELYLKQLRDGLDRLASFFNINTKG